ERYCPVLRCRKGGHRQAHISRRRRAGTVAAQRCSHCARRAGVHSDQGPPGPDPDAASIATCAHTHINSVEPDYYICRASHHRSAGAGRDQRRQVIDDDLRRFNDRDDQYTDQTGYEHYQYAVSNDQHNFADTNHDDDDKPDSVDLHLAAEKVLLNTDSVAVGWTLRL